MQPHSTITPYLLTMISKPWLALLGLLPAFGASAATNTQPNILFVLTDDRDYHMQSLEHMPLLQKYMVNEGTTYNDHYCTVAICCPSARKSLDRQASSQY